MYVRRTLVYVRRAFWVRLPLLLLTLGSQDYYQSHLPLSQTPATSCGFQGAWRALSRGLVYTGWGSKL